MRTPLISVIKRVLQQGQTSGVLRKGIDPLDLYISICALGFFVFSNKYTLGTIFNADLTSSKALNRRRSVIIEMLAAYLRPVAKQKRDFVNLVVKVIRLRIWLKWRSVGDNGIIQRRHRGIKSQDSYH